MALKVDVAAGLIASYIQKLIAEAEDASARYKTVAPLNEYMEKWLQGTTSYYDHASAFLRDHDRKRIRTSKHKAWVQEQLSAPLRKGVKTDE